MDLVKKWGLLLTVSCLLGAQAVDDPVMKARSQRSQAQGIEESDLPPVPRGVVEPPPLPPPETHAKDSPHAQATKTARRRGGKVRAVSEAPAESEPRAASPARAGSAASPARTGNEVRAGRKVRSAGKVRPGGKARAARPGKAAPEAKLNTAQKPRAVKPSRPAGKAPRPSRKRAKA